MIEDVDLSKYSVEQLEKMRVSWALKERITLAKTNMLDYMLTLQPDPDGDDPLGSLFEPTPLAKLLCSIIEKVDRGELKRVCVSVGPQFGKSQVLSRGAPSWLSGRKPRRHMILGSYNDTFAQEFGGEVRDIIQSEGHRMVFPEHLLKRGSEAKDNLVTTKGGKMAFVGVGGSGTGKPADIFFVDDPFKNDDDAQSETYRNRVWNWFNGVAFSRCHKDSAIIIVHTRWHEDDLIGRLVDPDHPERNKKYKGISERWSYYNLPAIVEDNTLAEALELKLEVPTDPFIKQQFGTKPMASLWENRKSLAFLAEAKQNDSRIFGALYMGRPSPEGGTYFKDDWLKEYDAEDLPKNLRVYAASDHAVSEKQKADYTVMGCVGIDEKDDIWVLPSLVWERMETDRTVEEMLVMMKTEKPHLWWMESELISKSFGPFLKKRMHEEKIYTTLIPEKPTKDKRTRARAIQGRMAMGKVHFPRNAHWWLSAKSQLLKFPYAANDDFVDWLSWIGLGLTSEYGASKVESDEDSNVIKVGSIEWLKAAANAEARKKKQEANSRGW